MNTVSPLGGVAPVSKRVMNLANFLSQAARRYSDQLAVVQPDISLTWKELDTRTNALAKALSVHGVCKGDRILVHSKNCHELLETQLAAFRLGAVWVPTNFRIGTDDAAYLAQASGANILIIGSEFESHALAIQSSTLTLGLTISIGKSTFTDFEFNEMIKKYTTAELFPNTDVDYDDPCWFFFTSGTTGRPKAGVLTHGQMGFVVTNHLCDLMPNTTQETDVSLVLAPLSHGSGIHFLTQLARGVKTILPSKDGFDVDEVWSLVEKHQVTNVFTVPTIINMLVNSPSVDNYDHSSLRYVIYAGAPMYREDQKQALSKLGKVLVQYYGLGEVTGNITVLPTNLHTLSDEDSSLGKTCGFERTGMQVSIQDKKGHEVNLGESGEICVCGPAVFAGYYNNPKANEESFNKGWFKTGDLGHMDSKGFIYITGRSSDMYISGGSNIYPRELEEKILTHIDVKEVAVVGMPDSKWGEVGVAAIVLKENASTNENNLLEWFKLNIASYKAPKRIEFFDELPKSGYGKITKKIVKEKIEKRSSKNAF